MDNQIQKVMETNTVIISKQEYDELRSFELMVKDPDKYCVLQHYDQNVFVSKHIRSIIDELNKVIDKNCEIIQKQRDEIASINVKWKEDLRTARNETDRLTKELNESQLKSNKHGWFRSK